MSASEAFAELNSAVAEAMGMHQLNDSESCLAALERAEKEIRELKYQVFHARYPSGLPMEKR